MTSHDYLIPKMAAIGDTLDRECRSDYHSTDNRPIDMFVYIGL